MREIKFRGLRTDGKGFVYGVPFYNHEERICFIIDNMKTLNFTTEDTKFDGHTVIPESVGQFTGLKDKNGIDIYEGDVFTADFYPFKDGTTPNYNGIVEWICAGFQYTLRCINPNKRGISEGINEIIESGDWIQITGNIHVNN